MVALVLSLMVKHEEEGGDRWFCALILVAVAQQVVGRFVLRTQVVYSLFTSPFGLVNDGRAGQSGPGVELQGDVVGVPQRDQVTGRCSGDGASGDADGVQTVHARFQRGPVRGGEAEVIEAAPPFTELPRYGQVAVVDEGQNQLVANHHGLAQPVDGEPLRAGNPVIQPAKQAGSLARKQASGQITTCCVVGARVGALAAPRLRTWLAADHVVLSHGRQALDRDGLLDAGRGGVRPRSRPLGPDDLRAALVEADLELSERRWGRCKRRPAVRNVVPRPAHSRDTLIATGGHD